MGYAVSSNMFSFCKYHSLMHLFNCSSFGESFSEGFGTAPSMCTPCDIKEIPPLTPPTILTHPSDHRIQDSPRVPHHTVICVPGFYNYLLLRNIA